MIPPPPHPWMYQQVSAVAFAMGVDPAELFERSGTGRARKGRDNLLSKVRGVAAFLLRVAPHRGQEPSYPEIARACGFGGHASVIGAVRLITHDQDRLREATAVAGRIGISCIVIKPGAVPGPRVRKERATP